MRYFGDTGIQARLNSDSRKKTCTILKTDINIKVKAKTNESNYYQHWRCEDGYE